MKWRKTTMLVWLVVLPFVITAVERLVIAPLMSSFPLPTTSVYMAGVGAISILLLIISCLRGNVYGMELSKKHGKAIAVLFAALAAAGYLFLFALQVKGFLDALAIIHLANWIITVFREEFILRGVIQTEAKYALSGSFIKISKAVWFTSIVFSLWHLVNLTVWPWQTVAVQMVACIPSGLILGVIREKTGNTLITYLLHIIGDLLFFSLYLLIFGKLFFTLF